MWDKAQWCSNYPKSWTSPNRTMKSSGDHHPSLVFLSNDETLQQQQQQQHNSISSSYENPDYDTDPCQYERMPFLFLLTLEEADLCTRLLVAVILGALIGYERRSTDRPAGIRTMGLVSLGSCFFTISSELAFKSSPMSWDASRVAAAIPSGVGFLGAGLIWKVRWIYICNLLLFYSLEMIMTQV